MFEPKSVDGNYRGNVTLRQALSNSLNIPAVIVINYAGVLEVIDKQDGGRFSIDDVEIVTLLGGIAGAALADAGDAVPVVSPDELASGLRQLAVADPARYASVAEAVRALLGG